jgi:hypothetical protein
MASVGAKGISTSALTAEARAAIAFEPDRTTYSCPHGHGTAIPHWIDKALNRLADATAPSPHTRPL